LQRTVIVPTLQTHLPPGKSVVWCATLALAWQQLEKKLGKGPLVLEGAEQIVQALDQLPDVDLLSEHYYVAAGVGEAGFEESLRRELRARFPRAPIPHLPPFNPEGFLTYAHVEASIRYEFAFHDSEQPLRFKDSQGRVTPVPAFGIREQDELEGKKSFRGQVRVLFRQGKDFAVDLSWKSRPYQIILARMPRKATLKATLADLKKRVARALRQGQAAKLGDGAILLIPNMNWRIERRFKEMEGKRIRHASVLHGSTLDMAFNWFISRWTGEGRNWCRLEWAEVGLRARRKRISVLIGRISSCCADGMSGSHSL
jgi:hypothetical protein